MLWPDNLANLLSHAFSIAHALSVAYPFAHSVAYPFADDLSVLCPLRSLLCTTNRPSVLLFGLWL